MRPSNGEIENYSYTGTLCTLGNILGETGGGAIL